MPTLTPRLVAAVAALLGAGLVVPHTAGSATAATSSVGDGATLVAALGTCTDGDLVTVAGDIDASMSEVTAGCSVTLDLAGHDVDVRRVVVATSETLTITDSSAADPAASGTLTADLTDDDYNQAAIRTTGATLAVTGTAHVVAVGYWDGAAIGGDDAGESESGGGTLVTSGSATVTADGGTSGGAGIGGGWDGHGGTVTANDDSTITATGGRNSAGIGGGWHGHGGTVTANDNSTITATGKSGGAGIGGGDDGGGGAVTANDDSTITATGGPTAAGIGGGRAADGGVVTANDDSTITATGGDDGAGIGGGYHGSGGTVVTHAASEVIAAGGIYAAGIGGGYGGDGGTVTTHDTSTITATGEDESAGIGGGADGAAGSLTIAAGTVTAVGDHTAVGSGYHAFGVPPDVGTLVVAGTLRVPEGQLVVADNALADPEVTVAAGGLITGSASDPATYGSIVGAVDEMGEPAGGRIANAGSIVLPDDHVGDELTITGQHHEVTFDPNLESEPPLPPVRVLAPRLSTSGKTLPELDRPGWAVTGWNTAADGSGAGLTAETALPGTSLDGDPVAHTYFAQWGPVTPETLADELADCTDGDTVTVGAPIAGPTDALTAGCSATIDLAGHDVDVRSVTIAAGDELIVMDSTHDADAAGTLTADASAAPGVAGVRTTSAALVTSGTAQVVATGGEGAAGIGGGPGKNAGTLTARGRSTVTATGGASAAGIGGGSLGSGGRLVVDGGTVFASGSQTAIGAGTGGSTFGAVEVANGTLTLPEGVDLVLPDSDAGGPEVRVGVGGRITGEGAIVPGSTTGQIDNDGAILMRADQVEVPVLGHHYAVAFDLAGGTGATPDPVVIFAPTITAGDRETPSAPSRTGHDFAGWSLDADDPLSAPSGTSIDGDPVPLTSVAQWEQLTVALPAPVLSNTTSAARGLVRPAVGDTLTATVGATEPGDATVAWTWRRDSGSGPTAIAGASGASYVVTAADVDATLSARAVASRDPWLPGESLSAGTGPVALRAFPTTYLSIEGSPAVGGVLTGELSPAVPAGAIVSWQWQRVGSGDVPGATGPTYTPTTSDLGRALRLAATITAPGHATVTTTGSTAPVAAGALSAPQVTVSGAARDRGVLRGTVTLGAQPPGHLVTYAWRAGGKVIPRANRATYQLRPGQIGKRITLTITVSATGYQDAHSSSMPTAVVKPAAKPYVDVATPTAKAGQPVVIYGRGPAQATGYRLRLGKLTVSAKLPRTDSFERSLRLPRGGCGKQQVSVTFLDAKKHAVRTLNRPVRVTGC